MRFIAWNMALAAWLLISAFALGHSAESSSTLTPMLAFPDAARADEAARTEAAIARLRAELCMVILPCG